MNHISVKWEMRNSRHFTALYQDYYITVQLVGIAPYWSIIKGGVIIEECYQHSPTKNELTAKVQAERVLAKLLAERGKDY